MYQYEKPECQTNGCTNANDSKENEFQPRKANKKQNKKTKHPTLGTANTTDFLPNNAVLNSYHYAQMSVL